MKLSVLSLKGVEFDGDIKSLNIKTTSGEITVLDNHRPLITSLKEGTAVIEKNDGARQELSVRSGFLEVSENRAIALID